MHRSAISSVGFTLLAALALGSLALAAPAKKRKGSPAPTSNSTPAAESVATGGTASVRLWKAEFASKSPVRLEVKTKAGQTGPLRLEPPATGAYFSDYAACPAGEVTVEFLTESAAGGKIPAIPITLAADSFVTLLLREQDGKPVLEVLDDAPTGSDPDSAEFVVRNFAPALVEIRIQAGDQLSARMRAAASFLNIRGLDRQRCQIDTITRDAEGKESRWSTEVNFASARKATLLIHADPYGRIRPRIALDGQPAPSQSGAAPAQ